jgi:hypothetical protein
MVRRGNKSMMVTSWFDGPLRKANINNQHRCDECGGTEEHCIVFDDGKKQRLCDECYKRYIDDLNKKVIHG